jgi:hypothetical protein
MFSILPIEIFHLRSTQMTALKNKQGIPVITVDLDEPAFTRWIKPGRKIASLANELTDSSPRRI